jgi:opacity protein-like surface antigen
MRGVVLAAAVMLGTAASAQAADMPDFLRGSLGGSAATVNWQGFYFGGQAGYGTSNMTFSGSTTSIVNNLLANTDLNPGGAISTLPLGGKVSVHGDGFGGFAGYNSQWTDVILGVELSYLHASFNGGASGSRTLFFTDANGFTDTVTNQSVSSIAISDMGTFRVRGGYAVGCFLPYLFGGIALGQANIFNSAHVFGTQVNSSAVPPQNIPFNLTGTNGSFSHLIYGYSAGLGVDVNLIGGLFMRAEWEYIRFTDQTDVGVNTVRAGLGYKF